ncbi:hypothetical protein RN001_008553 [Aquatica leii]|uniref:Mutator-like transposase domain-containing protein n=1 Tax=Aquatica leii TaxID=1421715 RepID=A0AAN7P9S4_9COLE|nr:hypothetical protein RN001_008553 [Aquatica leii]
MHNLRYKQFIADGDSCVYAKIQQIVPYGAHVTKMECTNHAIKNYGKRLHTLLKTDTKNVSAAARKQLSPKVIVGLQRIAQKAVYSNAHGDIDTLIQDLNNGPNHVFNQHTVCKDYYCDSVGDISNSQIKDVQFSGILRLIQGK